VVGEQTFGKGTVQEHRPLGRPYDLFDEKLGSIQFTIAKFYRINGGSTQHKGVVPDILYPSAIDPQDWGESQEDNALPWDNIMPVSYNRSNDISGKLPLLISKHQARIKQDPEFAYLYQDIEEYRRKKDDKSVSLVEAERIAEKEQQKVLDLTRLNERLTRYGFDKVESLEADIPKEIEELDPFLEETAQITSDLITLGQFAKRID
jgi:carboxyl-terminal processing protease